MAEFFIRNTLNPNKVVKCDLTFRQVVPKDYEGEPIWIAELVTQEPHLNGGVIRPVYINLVDLDDLDSEVTEAVETISAQINWLPLDDDARAPIVTSYHPVGSSVSIEDHVIINLEELFPAEGIDLSSLTMTINGFDVTPELIIEGDPYAYNVKWKPFKTVYDYENA